MDYEVTGDRIKGNKKDKTEGKVVKDLKSQHLNI